MHVVYQTTVNSLRQKEQDIVKAGWEKLGVEVELKSVDAGVFFSSDAGNPDTAAHFYTDVEMFTNNPSSPDYTAVRRAVDDRSDRVQRPTSGTATTTAAGRTPTTTRSTSSSRPKRIRPSARR